MIFYKAYRLLFADRLLCNILEICLLTSVLVGFNFIGFRICFGVFAIAMVFAFAWVPAFAHTHCSGLAFCPIFVDLHFVINLLLRSWPMLFAAGPASLLPRQSH